MILDKIYNQELSWYLCTLSWNLVMKDNEWIQYTYGKFMICLLASYKLKIDDLPLHSVIWKLTFYETILQWS